LRGSRKRSKKSKINEENLRAELKTRPLYLPNIALIPEMKIAITDSRGTVFKGVFRGYSSGFIALSSNCEESNPNLFLNLRRVNNIIVLGYCNDNNNK